MSGKTRIVCLTIVLLAVISVLIIRSYGGNSQTNKETIFSVTPLTTTVNMNKPIGFSSQIVELTEDEGQNYYVNYRIKREQLRHESKEMLSVLLNSDIKETREKAQKSWLELNNKISREGEIENVLKMKGYDDIVSDVNSEKVRITVLAEELKLQEINQIKSVTADITGFSIDKIEVSVRA